MAVLKTKICSGIPNLITIGYDPWLRYSDETIFKMAAVRHLEFSKIANLVIWPVRERDCASISRQSNNKSWRYSQKTFFNMTAVSHIGFVVTSLYCIWEHYFTFLTLCQIFESINLVVSDILGLSRFIILAWNLLFLGKIWHFWAVIRGQMLKLNILTLAWFRAFWATMRQNGSMGLISARASEEKKTK